MSATKSKRATVYFDPNLHKALRLKAAATERSLSDVVDEAVRGLLAEDAEDLTALDERSGEPTVSFEKMRLHRSVARCILFTVMRPLAHTAHFSWFWWTSPRTVGRSCANA